MWRAALDPDLAWGDEVTPGPQSKARAGLYIGLPGPAGESGAQAAQIQSSSHDCYSSAPDTLFPAPKTLHARPGS